MADAGQVVRYKHHKYNFEVLTKQGSVKKWRDGKLGLDNVLMTDVIFSNSHKGDRARGSDMLAAFDTEDNDECIQKILEKGTVQISAAEKREEVEQKRKRIVELIHKNYLNPANGLPHPTNRIETALRDVKFRVDPVVEPSRQVDDALKKLAGVLALKKSEVEATLSLVHKYIGSCSNIVHSKANVYKEKYTAEGCVWDIGLAPGDFDDFVSALNKVTKGDYQLKLAGGTDGSEEKDDSDKRKKGKKKKKGKRGK